MRRRPLLAILSLWALLSCDEPGHFGSSGPIGPDLKGVSIDIPELHQGETVTVSVAVESYGTVDVPAPFSVTLVVSTDTDYSTAYCGPFEWRREEAEGDLAKGEALVLEAELPVGTGDAPGTSLYFLLTADSGEEVDEVLETNNELAATAIVVPPPGPDLRVTACEPYGGELHEGESNSIATRIQNAGELGADGPFVLEVSVYSDPQHTNLLVHESGDVSSLPAGGNTFLHTRLPSGLTEGYIYFVAEVDNARVVPEHEYYRSDNRLEGSLRVYGPPLPDLIVSVAWKPGEPSGSEYGFTVTVTNSSDYASPAGTGVGQVLYGGSPVGGGGSFTFGPLGPRASEIKDGNVFAYLFVSGYTYYIRATVDHNDEIEELDENNNESNLLPFTVGG